MASKTPPPWWKAWPPHPSTILALAAVGALAGTAGQWLHRHFTGPEVALQIAPIVERIPALEEQQALQFENVAKLNEAIGKIGEAAEADRRAKKADRSKQEAIEANNLSLCLRHAITYSWCNSQWPDKFSEPWEVTK